MVQAGVPLLATLLGLTFIRILFSLLAPAVVPRLATVLCPTLSLILLPRLAQAGVTRLATVLDPTLSKILLSRLTLWVFDPNAETVLSASQTYSFLFILVQSCSVLSSPTPASSNLDHNSGHWPYIHHATSVYLRKSDRQGAASQPARHTSSQIYSTLASK